MLDEMIGFSQVGEIVQSRELTGSKTRKYRIAANMAFTMRLKVVYYRRNQSMLLSPLWI
jgi:hypothetical protein